MNLVGVIFVVIDNMRATEVAIVGEAGA